MAQKHEIPKVEGIPPSREVRWADGVAEGDAERVAFQIYAGDAGSLACSVVELELVMEKDRSRSIEAFAHLLKQKLLKDGYIVISDIDDAERQWHEEEVLGIPHERAQDEPEE